MFMLNFRISQDKSKDFIGGDNIIDWIEVIKHEFPSLQYVILCLKNSIIENIGKIAFSRSSTLISAHTKEVCKNLLKFKKPVLMKS